MIKIFVLLLLAVAPIQFLPAQVIQRNEILGRPTHNSITVQLIFNESAEVSIQYGKTPGVYSEQTPWQLFGSTVPAEIIIGGLESDTRYYYRVCYRAPGATSFSTRPEYSFQTQRPAGSNFTFTVEADPHLDEQSDTALYRLCLKNQLEDNPDFMIDLGDFLMSDKLKNSANLITKDTITYRCHLLRSFYESIGHSVPLFIALGNHEGEAGWNQNGTANNIAVWNTLERKKYFLNPEPNNFYSGDVTNYPYVGQREAYYAWQWGDALFIVIDPYWATTPKPDSLNGWRWTLGATQYNWLKQTLESSSALFKFVFAHQLVGGDPLGRGGIEFADRYEWGGNNLNGTPGFAANRPGWYKPIKDLLIENRVNVFFHGHDHFFARQQKECLIYQETPQPSLPNFTNTSATAYGYLEGKILPNSGHLKVSVKPSGVQIDYVRAYLPKHETVSRHNKDISATYLIGATNCYDSLITATPVIWNSNYADEKVYPNPFSTQTKIEFNLEKTSRIELKIYNMKGECVRNLLSGNLISPGRFHTYWDGYSNYGYPLPNGSYIYILTTDKGYRSHQQIVLMK